MKQVFLTTLCLLSVVLVQAQIVKDGERFSEVTTVGGKVVFIKETNLQETKQTAYIKLKEWAKENFGKDPFVSSVRYDEKNQEIIAKSRIELLLPANSKNVREKVVMRYRLNAFLFQGKYILEVKNISYMLDSSVKTTSSKTILKAEDMIVDTSIKADDPLGELKENTRKSTIYFLNELSQGLADAMK